MQQTHIPYADGLVFCANDQGRQLGQMRSGGFHALTGAATGGLSTLPRVRLRGRFLDDFGMKFFAF